MLGSGNGTKGLEREAEHGSPTVDDVGRWHQWHGGVRVANLFYKKLKEKENENQPFVIRVGKI